MTYDDWRVSRGYVPNERQKEAYNAATAAQREPMHCSHPAACEESTREPGEDYTTNWCGWCASLDKVRREERERCRLRMLQREKEYQACKDDFKEAGDE